MKIYDIIAGKVPASVEISVQAPFDNRAVVATKFDLINADTWRVQGEKTADVENTDKDPGTLYLYKGMVVVTADTNSIYIYKGNTPTSSDVYSIGEDNYTKFRNNATAVSNLSEANKNTLLNNLWVEYIPSSESGNKIGIAQLGTANEGYAKTYQLTYNGVGIENAIINIPKDLVVSSGSIVSGTWNNNTFTEGDGTGKAIKLVIANQSNDPIYINVNDLVDIYTVPDYIHDNNHTDDIIQLAIDNSNTITGSIKSGSITTTQLSQGINDSLSLADSSVQSVGGNTGTYITTSNTGTNSGVIITATPKLSQTSIEYNAHLTGAKSAGDSVPSDYQTKVGSAAAGANLTTEEAIAYNATLTGAIQEGEISEGLVTNETLENYVSDAIAGADNALYSISSGNNTYISVTAKNADPNDNSDDHTQQVSANVVTLASYNTNQSDGLISTSEVYNALTWN